MLILKKDPADKLDYAWDFATDYLGEGEVIVSQTVTSSDASVVVSDVAEQDGVVVAWAEGGVAGTRVDLVCSIETDAGRIMERTITLLIRDR